MKIGLVCPYDMFRSGGVQEHVAAQAKELRRRGHEVIIVTPRPRGFKSAAPEGMYFVGNSALVKTPISTNLELGITLERDAIDDMLLKRRFDILHVHEPEVPMLGAQIIAKADCPVIATFHAFYPQNAISRTIERLRVPYSRSIFSRLAAVTAVSDVAARFVRAHTDHEVRIIPNGIDLKAYKNSVKRRGRDILYVGRLERRKGVVYLIRAFGEIAANYPESRLLIAGEGPDLAKLRSCAESLALGDRVDFLGFVDDRRKRRLLKDAAVFCAPAIYGESFGIVLLEAMASGLPVVAGDNPGYATVLSGRGGLSLVNPRATGELARRLELFLTDDGVRGMWLDWAGREIKRYAYPKVVDEYETLYKEVITTGYRRRKTEADTES